MRQLCISNCEKEFLVQAFFENTRIDGRKCDEYRRCEIHLGVRRGSCFVTLGNTKTFAQVSSEIVVPSSGRTSAGEVFVNVEMSPMASQNFVSGRLYERGSEISRLLERILKESGCLDIESLCIVAGEKVWQIRVDIHVIDHDGSILDCAGIAAICALKSFRRPDVTIVGESFIVHPPEEKEPIALSLFHLPICVTFGLLENGKVVVVDSTEREEHVYESEIVVAMNSHKELCAIHCTGRMLLQKNVIATCCSMANRRANEVTDLVNEIFRRDTVERSRKEKVGMSSLVVENRIMACLYSPDLPVVDINHIQKTEDVEKKPATAVPSKLRKKGKVVQTDPSSSFMTLADSDEDEVTILSEIREASTSVGENVENKGASNKKTKGRVRKEKDKDVLQLLMDIEEDVVILAPKTKTETQKVERNEVEEIDLTSAIKKENKSKRRQRMS